MDAVRMDIADPDGITKAWILQNELGLDTDFGKLKYRKAVDARVWRRCYEYGYMSYYLFAQIETMMGIGGWPNTILLGYIGARGDRDAVVVGLK